MDKKDEKPPNSQVSGQEEETMVETKEKSVDASAGQDIKSNVEGVPSIEAKLQEHEYVTGIRLALVIGAVCAAAFVMLLDTSIVATVSLHFQNSNSILAYILLDI